MKVSQQELCYLCHILYTVTSEKVTNKQAVLVWHWSNTELFILFSELQDMGVIENINLYFAN